MRRAAMRMDGRLHPDCAVLPRRRRVARRRLSARIFSATFVICRSTDGPAGRRGRGSSSPPRSSCGPRSHGDRRRLYREAASWVGSGGVDALLADDADTAIDMS